MVTDELIAFYEKEIAKDTFISSMTTMKKNRLMSAYDISEKRLYLTLILQDLGARVDDHKDFNQIAQMNDKQLFSYGKTLVLSFIDTLTEEEKARLKDGFKSALGMWKTARYEPSFSYIGFASYIALRQLYLPTASDIARCARSCGELSTLL